MIAPSSATSMPRPSGSGRGLAPMEERVEQRIARPADVGRGTRAVEDRAGAELAPKARTAFRDGHDGLPIAHLRVEQPASHHLQPSRLPQPIDRRTRLGRSAVAMHFPERAEVPHEAFALVGLEPPPERWRDGSKRIDHLPPVALRAQRTNVPTNRPRIAS